eukprot:TRINITY_DN18249_c0_g3_i1.p1 TRINITY_DN18249_c0_g3~~TRINITY_DN18249_c0_g3_i1.p1  ORF type:complete len:590 (+),score=124.08 TRINITY_DN18249_c0_g3_i1:92-1861(+)
MLRGAAVLLVAAGACRCQAQDPSQSPSSSPAVEDDSAPLEALINPTSGPTGGPSGGPTESPTVTLTAAAATKRLSDLAGSRVTTDTQSDWYNVMVENSSRNKCTDHPDTDKSGWLQCEWVLSGTVDSISAYDKAQFRAVLAAALAVAVTRVLSVRFIAGSIVTQFDIATNTHAASPTEVWADPPTQPDEDDPITKKWWFWLIIAAGAACLLGLLAFLMCRKKKAQPWPAEQQADPKAPLLQPQEQMQDRSALAQQGQQQAYQPAPQQEAVPVPGQATPTAGEPIPLKSGRPAVPALLAPAAQPGYQPPLQPEPAPVPYQPPRDQPVLAPPSAAHAPPTPPSEQLGRRDSRVSLADSQLAAVRAGAAAGLAAGRGGSLLQQQHQTPPATVPPNAYGSGASLGPTPPGWQQQQPVPPPGVADGGYWQQGYHDSVARSNGHPPPALGPTGMHGSPDRGMRQAVVYDTHTGTVVGPAALSPELSGGGVAQVYDTQTGAAFEAQVSPTTSPHGLLPVGSPARAAFEPPPQSLLLEMGIKDKSELRDIGQLERLAENGNDLTAQLELVKAKQEENERLDKVLELARVGYDVSSLL